MDVFRIFEIVDSDEIEIWTREISYSASYDRVMILEEKLEIVTTLQAGYLQKFNLVDKTKLSIEQAAELQTQRKNVNKWTENLNQLLRDQISVLTLRKNTVWIKEQLDGKEKVAKKVN